LGTLIGADLTNLRDIPSIGVAGTFGGVFLSGIIAVLLFKPTRIDLKSETLNLHVK